tara:strand:+ start:1919 stop:2260 length:342 start_codon:yes stop_codon:yes gene_type:complete
MERNKDDNRQTEPKQPADVIRDGNLKASIWRNEGESGPFYATSFARSYKDRDGEYRDTHSFVATDLLKLSELARTAYTRTNDLHREEKNQRREEFREERKAVPERERQIHRER